MREEHSRNESGSLDLSLSVLFSRSIGSGYCCHSMQFGVDHTSKTTCFLELLTLYIWNDECEREISSVVEEGSNADMVYSLLDIFDIIMPVLYGREDENLCASAGRNREAFTCPRAASLIPRVERRASIAAWCIAPCALHRSDSSGRTRKRRWEPVQKS